MLSAVRSVLLVSVLVWKPTSTANPYAPSNSPTTTNRYSHHTGNHLIRAFARRLGHCPAGPLVLGRAPGCRAGTEPGGSRGGELLRRQRLEHAELVARRIGHHHPAHVRLLADVDPPGAEVPQPRHLGGLVLRPQVQVQPVLASFVLGYPQEQQVRSDPVLRAAGGRLEHDLVVPLEGAAPAERGLPEGRQSGRVRRIDAQALDANVHASDSA